LRLEDREIKGSNTGGQREDSEIGGKETRGQGERIKIDRRTGREDTGIEKNRETGGYGDKSTSLSDRETGGQEGRIERRQGQEDRQTKGHVTKGL